MKVIAIMDYFQVNWAIFPIVEIYPFFHFYLDVPIMRMDDFNQMWHVIFDIVRIMLMLTAERLPSTI